MVSIASCMFDVLKTLNSDKSDSSLSFSRRNFSRVCYYQKPSN